MSTQIMWRFRKLVPIAGLSFILVYTALYLCNFSLPFLDEKVPNNLVLKDWIQAERETKDVELNIGIDPILKSEVSESSVSFVIPESNQKNSSEIFLKFSTEPISTETFTSPKFEHSVRDSKEYGSTTGYTSSSTDTDLPLESIDLHRYSPPWTYFCGDDGKCHRTFRRAGNLISLETCWLTCGPTRTLWPKPNAYPNKIRLSNNTISFNIQELNLEEVIGPSKRVEELARAAFLIMKRNIQLLSSGSVIKSNPGKQWDKITISIQIKFPDDLITILTKEQYKLRIRRDKNLKTLLVKIIGQTFFGVRHGLETLSQLIIFDHAENLYKTLDDVEIVDMPAFTYRGLMIDTARNFIPINSLERMLDEMSHNKLNVLHWHISDSNSFPFYSNSFPEMTDYGAYSKEEIYYPKDIKNLIDYALVRGVKIIPELDAPAHAGNGWQWGNDSNGYGQLVLCVNQEPFNYICGQPPCGQLNPANPKVYQVLGRLYEDLLSVFDSDMFHMGEDEVSSACWNTKEIHSLMRDHYFYDFMQLRLYFHSKALKELKNANKRKLGLNFTQNGQQDPVPIIWTSEMTEGSLENSGIKPTEHILQAWEPKPLENFNIQKLLSLNFPLIISNLDHVYLDMGSGSWLGKNHDWRYINWQSLYNFDFEEHGYDIHKKVYNTRFGQVPQILGGEAPLWTEKVNEKTMEAKLWPRGAAFAERLWSNPTINSNRSEPVYARLLWNNERMRRRGILVDSRQPKSCLLINANCENELDKDPDL